MKKGSLRSIWSRIWSMAGIMVLFGVISAMADKIDSTIYLSDPPPGQCRILSNDREITFPFDIYRGDIRYECRINGQKVHMLLDDGYLWDQLLFWGNPVVDSLGLQYDGTVDIGGADSSGSGRLVSKTASGVTVGFPGVEFGDQTAIVTPSGSGVASWWRGSEGQISAMLLKYFVVGINFDDMMITLIKPDSFQYDGSGTSVPWEPLEYGMRGIPGKVTLADGRKISLTLAMDLGYNDQLELWTGKKNKITIPPKSLPASLGMNIQGIATAGYVGRLPQVEIGGYEIKDVLASFVPEKDSGSSPCEAMIGLNLLSRFNLTFDYYRRRLIIEPNKNYGEPFNYDMSGLSLRKGPDGLYRVAQIQENSPASEASLRVGDQVIKIDGRPAADLDIFEIVPLLEEEGKIVRLVVARDGREREVIIKLRRLL